ncbi:hypothetical protein [Sphingobacterium bambusae]|uniref:DUF4126 domain-containing protein n=1 Tax=Sphingobacterium bambusae TaxID=662858 RepID=A0ABW6BAV4_9SPHI|nr:hypothetical protein [Sphingobacterium bambusae]WPL48843.1 hypothetical protein SCB77_23095 [Sphingobacterium bambusae]
MTILKNLLSAFAGSVALNVIHELARKTCVDVPQINRVAEEAIQKSFSSTGMKKPKGKELYRYALTGDIVANTAYFTGVAGKSNKSTLVKGLIMGATAGLGALTLTAPMGLDDTPINRSRKTQILTVLYYVAGGLVSAGVSNYLRNRDKKISKT